MTLERSFTSLFQWLWLRGKRSCIPELSGGYSQMEEIEFEGGRMGVRVGSPLNAIKVKSSSI